MNMYRKFRCECGMMAIGAISTGKKDDGHFKLSYYCSMHFLQKQKAIESEMNRVYDYKDGIWFTKKQLSLI